MTGKTLNRRDFLRASALTAAGAALAGCATPTPAQVEVTREVERVEQATVVVQATAPPPEPYTVVIFVGFGTGTSAEQIAVHEAIAEEFNAQSDGITTCEFLTVPWAERLSKFSTMLAADMPPDVCMPIGIAGIASFFEAWEDITPFIERDNYDLSPFFGLTIELHSYPGRGQLGLPIGIYPSVVFYNEDIFDAAGVDYPPHASGEAYADGDAWTTDKVVEVARKLTIDENGNDADSPAFDWETTVQWGWNGWDWGTIGKFAAKWGGRATGVSEDYKTALVNSEPWVTALTYDKQCRWDWHIRATAEQGSAFYVSAGDPMGSGLVGMWECHSWMRWAYGSWTEAFNWDVGAVPAAPGHDVVAGMHADTFVMTRASEHKDQAWEVMKWMFTPDILKRLCDNWGAIPAHMELAATWVDDMLAQYPDVDFAVFLDMANFPDVPNHEAWKPRYDEVNQEIGNAEQLVFTGENLNVQEVLDQANANIQTLLDEYWASQ